MQSMQAAEGKREQAFTFAKKLDDLLEKHQETEQALSDVSKPPINPKKLKKKRT